MDLEHRETSEEWHRALQALNSPRTPQRSFVNNVHRDSLPEQGLSRTFKELCGPCQNPPVVSLQKLRNSPGLLLLRVWHTYGIWVGACVYFIISANLMLAWYIDWYRTSVTCDGNERCMTSQLLDFPLAPFFAIFCRSWLMVCIVGDLLRFCFILARDVWEDDAFLTYRRVFCCDVQLGEEQASARASIGGWSKRTSGRCGSLDILLQLSIYVALDLFPLITFIVKYSGTGQLGEAVVAASVSLAAGSCAHAFLFYLAMWLTDIVTKCKAFFDAWRGVARLQPCEYPGSSLQNFQWAGGFGDRMLDNLEAARCISVVEDIPDGPPDFVSPLGSEAGGVGVGPMSAPEAESSQGGSLTLTGPSRLSTFAMARLPLQLEASSSAGPVSRPRADFTIEYKPNWGSYLVTCIDGELSTNYLVRDRFDKDIPLLKDRSFVPDKEQFPLEIWRQAEREEQESEVGQRNLCVLFCKGWYPTKVYLQGLLPHLLCIAAIAVGIRVRNWGIVIAGVCIATFLVSVWLLQDCCCAREQPYFSTAAGSWELWALQAWGEHHCGLRYDVQRSRRITFGVVVLLQGMLFATLSQWIGMLVCFGVVLLVCLRTGGFALVRGPCFSDAGLARAQALAEEELSKVKSQAEQLGLASLAPWARPKPSLGAGNLFRFQEGASFSSGRLDMPLKSGTGALASREDLKELCEKLFRAPCVHSGRGAFWNFPNSGPEHWHRDGQLPLLTAVTVAKGYPKNAGFLRLQPFTHHGAIDEDADSHREPKVHAGESERVAAILQPGDLLLFLYSTKHAAVPNLSDQDRCLLYSVYGPENVQDEINCCDGRPSLKTYSKAEAEILLMMANALQHCMVYRERPWGWLVGMMIGLGHAVLAVALNFFWLDARWGITTLLLVLFHQLGLSRHNPRGFNVARFTALLLNGVLVVVVGVVVLTLATLNVNSDWSAFCKEGTPGCKYYEVPIFSANTTTPVECNQHYTYGVRGEKALSIPDFALFSALAYESEDGLPRGLQRYHPGWKLTYSRRAGTTDAEASLDWTTYFEFEDPENTTSVIAIRGTSTMLDVLDDMNIWLPAAFMDAFSIVGPKLSDAVAEAMARVSTPIYSDGLQKQYFSHLLEDVQRRRDQFPERRLYITGHSLGGGLAKLVAAKVGIPAVTFMAPGLESTSYLVFRQNMIQDLHNVALTVMPDNDVVSRVDIQSGITIKTECEGNMLHCHLLYPTICNFLDRCGPAAQLVPYLAHWALISILEKNPEALEVVNQALMTEGDSSVSQPLSCARARQAVNDLTDRCPVCQHCPTARVLGAEGPLELLPLQRNLLRRLAFDAGATRGGVHLAQQAVSKALAQRSPALREVLLDVAELLNLRAYARTYVSSRPRVLTELEEALRHAADAMDCPDEPDAPGCATGTSLTPLRGLPRARLWLGRTLSSAAHSLALSFMQGAARERLLSRWESPQKMFNMAEEQHAAWHDGQSWYVIIPSYAKRAKHASRSIHVIHANFNDGYDISPGENGNARSAVKEELLRQGIEIRGLTATFLKMLAAGADPNTLSEGSGSGFAVGMTPLLAASSWGKVDEVRLLIAAGAELRVRTPNMQQTAMHLGNIESWGVDKTMGLLRFLVHRAPELLSEKNAAGKTPLDCAKYEKKRQQAAYLSSLPR
ncbi:Putative lipase ATG15 (Autophagy-related protein 15) [Durusdinium trenchii]|uniref:Lipase ATG15 (Autophagy-related protein 15) n=1 Tax=Durusdinium trenchii TaxID=1381693 RepID=A0ABP0SDW6_9DINO